MNGASTIKNHMQRLIVSEILTKNFWSNIGIHRIIGVQVSIPLFEGDLNILDDFIAYISTLLYVKRLVTIGYNMKCKFQLKL